MSSGRAAQQLERHLRFGIIVPRPELEAWQMRAVQALLKLPNTTLDLIVYREETRGWRSLLWWLLRGAIARPPSSHRESIGAVFPKVPFLGPRSSETITEADLSYVRGFHLDFFVHFGNAPVDAGLQQAASYGAWMFLFGDDQGRSGPPAFWEVFHAEPETAVRLQRMTQEPDLVVILQKGSIKTIAHSYADTLDRVRLSVTDWPASVAAAIQRGDESALERPPVRYVQPPWRGPSSIDTAALWWRLFRRRRGNTK
jgi:hypothetical protein